MADGRARPAENPFYGANPAKEVGISHYWVIQMASCHNAGANLNFADGHVSYFKYAYICSNVVTKAINPGKADIHWAYNGSRIP